MKTLRRSLTLAVACLLPLGIALAQDQAAPQRGFGRGPGQGVGVLGQHEVTMTDTGAVVTITSNDPAVAERIIAMHTGAQAPPYQQLPADVTRTVEPLANGVRITMVGATPAAVQWIQERHATVPAGPPADVQRPQPGFGQGAGPGFGRGQGAGLGRRQGGYGQCAGPGLGLAVGPAAGFPAPNHEVVNLENGIQVTITSANPDQVAMLQQRAAPGVLNCPYAHRIQTAVQTIENGVIVTMTSDDAETVTWLQAHPPNGPQGNGAGQGQGRGQGRRGGGYGRGANR